MKFCSAIFLPAVAVAALALGCGPQPSAPGGSATNSTVPTAAAAVSSTNAGRPATEFATNVIAYDARGILRELRAGGTKALIAHEEIPGYMEAMVMLLDVRDTNELAGISAGDQITFRLLTTDTDAWIDRLKRTGLRVVVAPPDDGDLGPEEELTPGAPLPDCTLTNQAGRAFRLSDFKGQALAFTFIFTRCPLPTFCPRMTSHFGAVQKALLADSSRTNWHLLSISFDPEFDTPAQLAAYSRMHQPDPAHWTFATGPTDVIRKFGRNFGLYFARDGGSFNHNIRTVVVNPEGRVQKVFPANEWQPEELVTELKAAIKPPQ